MTFDKFKELVTQLYKLDKESSDWMDTVPSEINAAFFDNPFINAMVMTRDVLIPEVFGDLSEDVFWLLDEFVEGQSHQCIIDDVEYDIHTLDDFFVSVQSYFTE